MEKIVFDRRFRGPPESANGGYAAGVAARLLGGPASVRLLLPPPLDKPLDVEAGGDRVRILDGDAPVIEATPADIDIDVPPPVSVDEARRASERYGGFTSHPFPSCLVCGPERADGDGFRVFPGPVDGRAMLAATWTPTTDLAEDGIVRTEFVWAALDCPGGWAMDQSDERPHVLGTIAATLVGDVVPGETYVAIGWGRGTEGRKSFVGSALFTARGERVGHAAATWVALKDPRVFTG